MLYELDGAADKVRQVIRHFGLTIWHEYSQTTVDVHVSEQMSDELEQFCQSVGVSCREI